MDETFHSAFLSINPDYTTATSAHAWTSESEDSFHLPAVSLSSGDISVTTDHIAIAPIQGGTSWSDSSLRDALGHTEPPHVQGTPAQAPEPTVTSSCRIVSNAPCSQPLDGTLLSIRWHLSLHGHKHQGREMVQCPWVGCSDTLRWMNIPRHIRSIHLGVRMVCPTCERSFTRSMGLTKHIASKKCSVTQGTSDSMLE